LATRQWVPGDSNRGRGFGVLTEDSVLPA